MARELTKAQIAERSIIKKYRKELWNPFIAGVQRYSLIDEGDRIAVCISGGKDSMLMAKLMGLLQRTSKVSFELVYLVMNPGYSPKNLKRIEDNASILEVPVTVFETDIFEVADSVDSSPCYLCARMRRGHLYSKAKELGCNRVALGHHFDDVVETFMMNLFFEGRVGCFSPVTYLSNTDLYLIRPMIYAQEKDVEYFVRHATLPIIESPCPENHATERENMKKLLSDLERGNDGLRHRLFGALCKSGVDGWSLPRK